MNVPKPNPQDWTDVEGAAKIIGVRRAAVNQMIDRQALHRYYAGQRPIFWVPECLDLAAARSKIQGSGRK
jgi:hypothetical protein